MVGAECTKKGFGNREPLENILQERKVDKPTPTFEGPAGSALTSNSCLNLKIQLQEKEYIKILKR